MSRDLDAHSALSDSRAYTNTGTAKRPRLATNITAKRLPAIPPIHVVSHGKKTSSIFGRDDHKKKKKTPPCDPVQTVYEYVPATCSGAVALKNGKDLQLQHVKLKMEFFKKSYL